MEDIIDIIVTETTNLIEITSQPTDEVIDVNIIDNREDITLNVTPSVVEININSLTGNFGVEWGDITGTLSNQTDLNTALSLKADLVDGKVPSSQLPSYVDDVVEVANYASLPATGEVGKIYITLDTNFIYRWTGSTYVEIKDSSAVWGAITGTLSNQTDLQSALDSKLNVTTAASTYLALAGGTMTGQIVLKEASSSSDYTKGLRFPNNPGGGANDISGLRLYVDSTESQVLELYIGNDSSTPTNVDKINFATGVGGTADNDLVTINGNKIWNAGNLTNPISGSGTTNYVPKFTATSVIGNSNIQDSGSLITLGSNTTISSGALGIGTSSLTGFNLRVSKNITGAITSNGIVSEGQTQSDVTNTSNYFLSFASTSASSFTLTSLFHFRATQSTFGAGSTVTNQNGFQVDTNLVGATNNYGFRGLIPSGTNRWNLYMDGTASNHIAGSLGIGSTALTGYNLRIQKTLTGATASRNIWLDTPIASDVTSSAVMVGTSPNTLAASFTLNNLYHFYANSSTNGAGSSINNNYGFYADSNLIQGTNAYGFYGNIASGTNRWNLYMAGTANNYLAGSLGIGNTSLTGYSLRVTKNITGATTSIGIHSDGTIQSDVTGAAYLMSTNAATQAASFTLNSISHYRAFQTTFGAGSTVTNQYGFLVDASLTGATNNYGFFGNIASGTNRWNLYMAGTANNHLAGNLLIGSTADTGEKLQVTGNARIAKTVISSVSVGTIAGLGSSTVTIISAKSGTISLAAQIIITGLESQNNGAIMITSNLIGNWSSGSLNKYGLGTTVSNESLGGNDYRGYGQLVPTVGTSGNSITLTLTNLQLSSISNISVSVIEYSN